MRTPLRRSVFRKESGSMRLCVIGLCRVPVRPFCLPRSARKSIHFFAKELVPVKRWKQMLGALLAIVLLTGTVPAYAAEQTEMPDYFGIQSDAVKTTTGHTFTLSYGRPGEEVYDSFEVTDDFYYAIEPDGQITVTNTNPSDTGFVYMYCEVYYPKTSMTGYDGSTIQIPGGYFCDVDEDLYYLGENGQWISVWYGYWLLGAVTEDYAFAASERVDMADVQLAWETRLESVYPHLSGPEESAWQLDALSYEAKGRPAPLTRTPRPRALIPVFPGTNCEFDTARALRRAGAMLRLYYKNGKPLAKQNPA